MEYTPSPLPTLPLPTLSSSHSPPSPPPPTPHPLSLPTQLHPLIPPSPPVPSFHCYCCCCMPNTFSFHRKSRSKMKSIVWNNENSTDCELPGKQPQQGPLTAIPSPFLLAPAPYSPSPFSPSHPLTPLPLPLPVEPDLFSRQEVVRKPKGTSHLSVLLEQYSKLAANPFFEFGKFNGEVS